MKDISSRLMVDQSTVRRILQLFDNTETVTNKNYPESHAENLRSVFDYGVGDRETWDLPQ